MSLVVDPSNSSTFRELDDEPFRISYLDGSGANGTYFEDHLTVGGAEIESLQMGLAESSTINSGLMGIGYSTNVATRNGYSNIIDLLEEQDMIAIKAYSLWLVRFLAGAFSIAEVTCRATGTWRNETRY